MGAVLSIRRSIACLKSYGICVVVPHGLFVMSGYNANKLHMYSLIDGTRIRSIGSQGGGKGQFNFDYGGLCTSSDGDSVLVAEYYNDRVQEVRIVDGTWVRFIGEGVLNEPQYVDCNADVIVVSESGRHSIKVLSWADGSVRARFGSFGSHPGHFSYPRGVRLLANGVEVVVADCDNRRLCVFTLHGELVAVVGSEKQGLHYPFDVLECATDGSFIVTNIGDNLIKLSRHGVNVDVYGKQGCGDGEFCWPAALAALPSDGCLVVDSGNRRVQYLARLHARLAWMRACACRIV
jgi:tripartite motif-containing protein 71